MSPDPDPFEPLLGLPSWLVQKGHGSFVTMEFGEPIVTVEEPRPRVVRIPGVEERSVPSRSAHVHGQWHLWIYCCHWYLTTDDLRLAHCESEDYVINRALRILNGQALTRVEVRQADGRTRFHFDLGCVLHTRPAPPGSYTDEPVEQWMLYEPDGHVLAVRGDGQFSRHLKDQAPESYGWLPIMN